jgi:hypothetical protein
VRPIAVLAAALIAGATAHGQGRAIRCDYRQRIECTASGCAPAPIAGGHLILADTATLVAATARARDGASLPTIQVCDATACTPIAVRAVAGGAFVNIAQDGGAHFVKVAVQDIRGAGRGSAAITKGAFVEVAAQFLSTVTHVGSCPALVASASTP